MALVSIFAAPTAGFIMDKFGLIIGLYTSGLLIVLGQSLIFFAAYSCSFGLMMSGRVLFGLGYEPLNTVKNIIIAKWFIGRELSFASNLNLSVSRCVVFLNGYCTPWVARRFGYTWAFFVGSLLTIFSWMSCLLIASL